MDIVIRCVRGHRHGSRPVHLLSVRRPLGHVDAASQVPPVPGRRAARPHLARPAHHERAALGLGRPARRQPGAHQPHGRRAQAAHVRAARAPSASRRSRSASRRPRRPTSTSCACSSTRSLIPDDVTIVVLTQARDHLIERTFESLRGRPAVDRPPLQLDLDDAAPRRLPARPRRHPRHRRRAAPTLRARAGRGARTGTATCASSTRPRASPAPSPTTRSRSARRSWTCSSRRPSAS